MPSFSFLHHKKILPVSFFSQRSAHKWSERGFDHEEDARIWEKRSCGIASLKMILDTRGLLSEKKFAHLVKETYEKGAYKDGIGWIHQGLVDVLNEHGFEAKRIKIENIQDFKNYIDLGYVFIVSIGAGFTDNKTSGHLVVLNGYRSVLGRVISLIVQHTSSLQHREWPNKELSKARFIRHFSGNAIMIKLI